MRKAAESYWIGLDLGGTKMLGMLFDPQFKVVATERVKTKAQEGATAVLRRLTETIESLIRQAEIDPRAVKGIGMGCPGPLDLDRGIVLLAPNLGWRNVALKEKIERAFRCPAVVANDVDAGLYGEYRFGAARGSRCAVGVFPGTGIGGACVYEGRLLRGRTGSAMEIGHMVVDPDGPLCGCGQRGCLEAVASRLAIAAEAAIAAHRGQAPHLLTMAGTDITAIRSGTLARAIRAGDTVVEDIVRKAARKLGVALIGVVHLLAPDRIVLGGGLVEALPKIFVEEVKAALNAGVMKPFLQDLKVVPAQLGDEATAKGAAALAADTLGAKA